MSPNPEVAHSIKRLDDLRAQMIAMVKALPAEGLNFRPMADTPAAKNFNSIAVLGMHTAGAEQFWIHENIGGAVKTRDREAEFSYVAETGEEIIATHERVGAGTCAILSGLDESQLSGNMMVNDLNAPVRWAILHIIDHTALHLGHMQITYQLWHDGVGVDAPRWFDRL
jgi:uncharacterized damage-inducible protein DinB